MARHHGINQLKGMPAFYHYGHEAGQGDRFGRLFSLPPLYIPAESLRKLGALGGPMDGGTGSDRNESVPVGQIFFGQFIDHDITLDVTSSLSGVSEAEEVSNVRTPTLDLDNIYGTGPEANSFLYRQSGPFAGVKLLTGADGTAAQINNNGSTEAQPPYLAAQDLWRSPEGTAVIGDHRNDENRILSQLHLAMIRFHNGVAQMLYDSGLGGETIPEEELFEEARRLTRWHYQWVVLQEYLPLICGQAVVADILGSGRRYYCPKSEIPYIPVEFAVAAYRFGHSMVPQRVRVQEGGSTFEVFGQTLGRGFEPLDNLDAVVDWYELVNTSLNRNIQKAETLDRKLASEFLKLPFIPPSGEQSLATRNLLRGQAFLLPSGEEVARTMGRDEDEIANVSESARDLTGSEIDLSNGIPLWYYLLVEAERIGRETEPGLFEEGEGLGPVGARIVAETLIGLIELDPRSFLSRNRSWDPVQDGVGVTSLSEMLTY